MSSPDPRAHDRSDEDYGMKPSPKSKALKKKMRPKSAVINKKSGMVTDSHGRSEATFDKETGTIKFK